MPGHKGAGGRPKSEWKALMAEMAALGEDGLREILRTGAQHSAFLAAVKHVTENAYGKPKDETEHSGEVTVRIVREARAIER